MKLRYSEAFYPSQGEGRFVGVPRPLRILGCNLYEFWTSQEEVMCEKKELNIILKPKQLLDDGVLDKVEKFEDLPIIPLVVIHMQVSSFLI